MTDQKRKQKFNYRKIGQGETIVLLHGYLETSEIWNSFAQKLSLHFQVITVDLPGHGLSPCLPNQNMENMAEALLGILDDERLDKVNLVGHSMGGYVSLAFLELFSERLKSICLFHSHPFADSPQAFDKRNREIKLVGEGKKDFLAKTNIPNAFATDNLEKFSDKIAWAKEIALNNKEEGIIACLKAMQQRKDRSEVWEKSKIPSLLISGAKDNYMPEELISRIPTPKYGKHLHLLQSGHQGFIEEEDQAVKELLLFVQNKDSTSI